MIETITLITLILIFMFIVRPGRTPPLANPLTINRIGQYHAVLAPKINLAQPLLESISRHLPESARKDGNTQPLYFKVQDNEVDSHGHEYYLLAMTLRDGMLYFQATSPVDNGNPLETIREFSEAELAKHPASATSAESAALMEAIQAAAKHQGATVTPL